jgi:hypothetical protein
MEYFWVLVEKINDCKKEIKKIDPEYLYYPPNHPAKVEDIYLLQEKMGFELPEEYIKFLLQCNGWDNLIASIDLLGTHNYEKGWELAQEIIELMIEEEDSNIIDGIDFTKVIPIGVGFNQADGTDLILMYPNEDNSEAKVFWWRFYMVGEMDNSLKDFLEDIYTLHVKKLKRLIESQN